MSSPIDPLLYRLTLEQTKDYAVCILSPEGYVLTWGAGGETIKGYRADEIIGRHFSVFYTHEALSSKWPQYELKVATAEGRFEDEGWRVRKDGSRFWASVVITALRDESGKLRGFSKIVRDLTERRARDEELRESEERFRLLVDGVSDYAIYLLDTEGVVTSWNTGAERITGYTRQEIVGKHFSKFYSEAGIAGGKPWEELALARQTGRAEDEGWRVKKNGDTFWARVAVTALHDSQGHLRGFAKVTQDLTERRYLRELEEATKNVSNFIATLTHELRNPLAPIRMAVNILEKMPGVSPELAKVHQMINRQSFHLSRILEDMMEASRVSQGKMTVDLAPMDIGDAVQRAVEASTPAIEQARHELVLDLPSRSLIVQGDVHRLTQLVTNLVNNAARYTPAGGRITVTLKDEDGIATVIVRDTGRGIDPSQMESIFRMFSQGDLTRSEGRGGLGVGLALARAIAELHGGSIRVHSEGRNKGSEFILSIPLSDRAIDAQPAPDASFTAIPAQSRRIMVVDDNTDAADMLNILLKSLGHETLVVHDGLSAIKMAEEFMPDIVLLDLGMPGMDGYETARQLRAIKGRQGFRLVAVTGWGQQADRQKTSEAGFDSHLVKPVDADTLMLAMEGRSTGSGKTLH